MGGVGIDSARQAIERARASCAYDPEGRLLHGNADQMGLEAAHYTQFGKPVGLWNRVDTVL